MMISIRNLNLRIKLKLWRFLGFASSIVGLICYALSSSFKYLIGDWTSFKLFLFAVLVLAICGTILFAKQWPLSSRGKLKAHLGFAVLMLTSLYSFFYDKAMNGKPDILSMVSNGSFALMSLSFSRVFMLGFEVGLFAFFLGCLAVQLMKINLMLIFVAVVYGYPLFLIHSSSDSSPDDKVDEPLGSGDNQGVVLDVDTILHEMMIQESEQSTWTAMENKLFDNALVVYDKDTPDRWVKIAAMVPGKTVSDVIKHYTTLLEDIRVIEGQQLRRRNVTGGASVEPRQIGLEDEIEKLTRDKSVLAAEIVRLRQNQQNSQEQIIGAVERLQAMEERQTSLNFLFQAVKDQSFMQEFVQEIGQNKELRDVFLENLQEEPFPVDVSSESVVNDGRQVQ